MLDPKVYPEPNMKRFEYFSDCPPSCCDPETMLPKGGGFRTPAEGECLHFVCLECPVCGRMWFREDKTGRLYAERKDVLWAGGCIAGRTPP